MMFFPLYFFFLMMYSSCLIFSRCFKSALGQNRGLCVIAGLFDPVSALLINKKK